jgi:allantoicase
MTTPMTDFVEWPDLLAERLGGAALFANDEFFAPKENLVRAAAPEFLPHAYTERGKLMDGWESRRRRTPGHDWCILRLGVPGVIRGFVVDTAHFKGNYPESCSIEGCAAAADARAEDLGARDDAWIEIVPRQALAGDTQNRFAVDMPWSFTHLRLNIFPDGGVARLRAHGAPQPDWPRLARAGEVDLAALENGGRVIATSDRFFGAPNNMLLPGRGTHMGDGWETRRRRGPGHDWAVIRLGLAGRIARVEVDTAHFKGNYPESCALEACSAPDVSDADVARGAVRWSELLPRQKLAAHTRHEYARELAVLEETTHVRLSIHPDGGVSRLRLYGELGAQGSPGRERAGVAWLDTRTPREARELLVAALGSTAWAEAVQRERPFAAGAALVRAAERCAASLARADWLEAFARHPRIGERSARAPRENAGERERAARDTARWSEEEQAGARNASSSARAALVEANRAYEARFGYTFIVCATGKSAEDMLAVCRARLSNSPEAELRAAADEQLEIARLRLAKLVAQPPA